jgi:TRAP-type C4-dicarboxylate transport system permease small subunit
MQTGILATRAWKRFDAIIGRVASVIYGFGSGILGVLMVFTFVTVALRYFFNSPIKGDVDLSSYMMVLVIPSGLALTALRKKHIRVDVLTQLLPRRVQQGLSIFAHLLSLALISLMVWQTVESGLSYLSSGTRPTLTAIPYYPFVFICAIYLFVFGLVILRDFIVSVVHAVRGSQEDEADVSG